MKIAVIGSGISGLSAAYVLSQKHDVTLFEKNDYLGGHSNTITINHFDQQLDVDTGFIVFNKQTYPNLINLFHHLKVPYHKSDMSFGITVDQGKFEYSGRNIAGVFAQRKNIFNLKYWKMLCDLAKFNRISRKIDLTDTTLTLEKYLKQVGVGDYFKNYYLYPMVSAIWSTPRDQMTKYPAATFLKFFRNHGLLQVINQPQWYTVTGGSKNYIQKMMADFRGQIYKNCEIKSVKKAGNKIKVTAKGGEPYLFDTIVMAAHADQAAKMLKDFPQANALSKIKYESNDAYLHKDTRYMPKTKAAWASWVYLYTSKNKAKTCLTYWMNLLQLPKIKEPILVTLNPGTAPKKSQIYYHTKYMHPVYDAAAMQAQDDIKNLQGQGGVWVCGAYMGYGFHEDGLKSALDICDGLGVSAPWY